MAKVPKVRPKQGRLSGTQRSAIVAQEVVVRNSATRIMEVRNTGGEVLFAQELPEPSSGFQVTPDGRLVYALLGGARHTPAGLMRELTAIDMASGAQHVLGYASLAAPAVDETCIAYFCEDRLVVADHAGQVQMEATVGAPAALHGAATGGVALLPGGRVAFSRSHRAEEKIADLTVLDADGNEGLSVALPAPNAFSGFWCAGLIADAQGERVAILGEHAGLVLVDLARGQDIAERFAPHPMDLADDRPTTHAHHNYRGFAFDEAGRAAASYRPGWLTLWDRDGTALRREEAALNPKAAQLVTFDNEGLAFFDSYGASAHYRL